MTHAYRKGLFLDPDHSNPLHDLACRYIGDEKRDVLIDFYKNKSMFRDCCPDYAALGTDFEYPIVKGKTIKGYIDVYIHLSKNVTVDTVIVKKTGEGKYKNTGRTEKRNRLYERVLCIEVKTTRPSGGVGTIIRQIRYYHELMEETSDWILVTTWKPTETDIELLNSACIDHLYLGDGFNQWAKREGEKPAEDVNEI